MSRIAIVGAGASGLAAAFQLSKKGHEVCVFEKSRGVSGRAASRSRNGCRYDYGANYFKPESNEVAELIFRTLPHNDLCRIAGDIWTFDANGHHAPGDPKQNASAKWTYRSGISTLGKLLIDAGNFAMLRESLITGLYHNKTHWTLEEAGNTSHGPFDKVLLTPPAPQSVDLLKNSEASPGLLPDMISVLENVPYHVQFSVMLNFNATLALPGDAYAMINTDRKHRLAWLSNEGQKQGHVPAGESLFIAQKNPKWSATHQEDSPPSIIAAAYESVNSLLGNNLPTLHWADTQRWRYAHPDGGAKIEDTASASEIGLYFAGDAFVGKGRVPGALQTGLNAAKRILAHT